MMPRTPKAETKKIGSQYASPQHQPLPDELNLSPVRLGGRREIPQSKITSTPKSTTAKLVKETKAVQTLEEKVVNLKQQLATLNSIAEPCLSLTKVTLSTAKPPLDINCAFTVQRNLFILGCTDGLYSMKPPSASRHGIVRIDGIDSVQQIELIPALKSVVLIGGMKYTK
jgi:hypothetical protein